LFNISFKTINTKVTRMAKPIRKVGTFLGVPNFSQLFVPPMSGSYSYFEGATKFPFVPDTGLHSHVNAWWMAELSILAYCEKKDVEQILNDRFPVSNPSFFWLDSQGTTVENNTQWFGLETDDFVILVFRGTEFPPPSTVLKAPWKLKDILEDIRTDIQKVIPETISEGVPTFPDPVHPGFAKALQSVWAQLQDRITLHNKPLWLTGHSLGGAIATLVAYTLPERVAALYTFGSPCVGPPAFAKSYNGKNLHAKTFRYQHGNDAVAKALDLYTTQYQHVGQLFELDAGWRRGPVGHIVNRLLGSTTGIDLLDHPPIFYSYECWNAIP
jgi:triacylglycerol lipase